MGVGFHLRQLIMLRAEQLGTEATLARLDGWLEQVRPLDQPQALEILSPCESGDGSPRGSTGRRKIGSNQED